jgi:hypothetical protein
MHVDMGADAAVRDPLASQSHQPPGNLVPYSAIVPPSITR